MQKKFQDYNIIRANDHLLPKALQQNPEFEPSKPTMIEGIIDLIQLFKAQFTEAKFRDCINRTFIKTGTLPVSNINDGNLDFVEYKKELLCGTVLIVPEGTIDLSDYDVQNNNDDMTLTDVDLLERAVINYNIEITDFIDQVSDSDDSDDE